MFSTGNSWQTARTQLGTLRLRANRKQPKTKSEPWAAWKNKHPKKLFLELWARRRVIWKNLEVRETNHWPGDLLESLGEENMRVFHCGTVPFRLEYFSQIKRYLSLFWLPKLGTKPHPLFTQIGALRGWQPSGGRAPKCSMWGLGKTQGTGFQKTQQLSITRRFFFCCC